MRYLPRLLFAMCATVILGSVAQAQKFSPAEQEVINVHKARLDAAARRDVAAWPRYVADDCIFTSDGEVVTKAKMLEHYKRVPGEYDRVVDPREYVVHLYGDTAVVNYVATDHEQYGPTDIVSEQRRTETLVKQNGSWLLWRSNGTVFPSIIANRWPTRGDPTKTTSDNIKIAQAMLKSCQLKMGSYGRRAAAKEIGACLPAGRHFFTKETLEF